MRSILRFEGSFGRSALALGVFTALALGGAACGHASNTSTAPTAPQSRAGAMDGRTNTMPPETGLERSSAVPDPRAAPAPGPMIQILPQQPDGTAPQSTRAAPPLPADTGAVYGAPPPPPLSPPKPAEPQASPQRP